MLCLPVSQRAAKLRSVKLWGLLHRPGLEPGPPARGSIMAKWQNFLSNLQLWQLVTLQSFVLQRPTVSLWKGLSLIKNILSIQKVGRIFNIGFALSKWPHLHRPYVVGGCLFNLGTVIGNNGEGLKCYTIYITLLRFKSVCPSGVCPSFVRVSGTGCANANQLFGSYFCHNCIYIFNCTPRF